MHFCCVVGHVKNYTMESQFCYVIVDQLRKCYRNMILLHSIQWNQTFTVHFFWKKMHNENMIQLHKLLHNRIMIPFCHNSCYTMESWFRYETNLQHNGIVIPSCNNLCNTTESWFRWFDKKGVKWMNRRERGNRWKKVRNVVTLTFLFHVWPD